MRPRVPDASLAQTAAYLEVISLGAVGLFLLNAASAPMLCETAAETAWPTPQQGSPATVLILRPTPEAAVEVISLGAVGLFLLNAACAFLRAQGDSAGPLAIMAVSAAPKPTTLPTTPISTNW